MLRKTIGIIRKLKKLSDGKRKNFYVFLGWKSTLIAIEYLEGINFKMDIDYRGDLVSSSIIVEQKVPLLKSAEFSFGSMEEVWFYLENYRMFHSPHIKRRVKSSYILDNINDLFEAIPLDYSIITMINSLDYKIGYKIVPDLIGSDSKEGVSTIIKIINNKLVDISIWEGNINKWINAPLILSAHQVKLEIGINLVRQVYSDYLCMKSKKRTYKGVYSL